MTGFLTDPTAMLAAAGLLVALVAVAVLARALRNAARGATSRARAVTIGLLIPAAMALAMSASTSYRYAGTRLDITDLAERLALCGTAEAAIVALTLHSWGTKSRASAWAAYCLVGVQAVPAFSVSGGMGGVVRIALGPVLLAATLHLLLGLEMKFSGEKSTGLLATAARELRERIVARLGIGRRGADSAEIARSRAADRAVRLASSRKLGRRGAARLAVAIDAAQHGLDEIDAAAAEASIVARVVRRKSVAGLHALDARHVWSTTAVSALVSEAQKAPEVIAEPDSRADIQPAAEPAVWVRQRGLVSGRRGLQAAPRTVRRARSSQTTKMPVQQPEQAPVVTTATAAPTTAAEPKRRVDTKVAVPAMRTAYPDMSVDTIADALGVNERTVRRWLPAKDVHLERANGTEV